MNADTQTVFENQAAEMERIHGEDFTVGGTTYQGIFEAVDDTRDLETQGYEVGQMVRVTTRRAVWSGGIPRGTLVVYDGTTYAARGLVQKNRVTTTQELVKHGR